MTDAPTPGTGAHLEFNGPLSGARADRLAADLAARRPTTVVDLGCGWGELLLRVVARCPDAHGVGVESHGPDVLRGRANAAARGLADRVTFVEGSAAAHREPADVVLSIGAWHALGDLDEALRALRGLVNPGGRVLFGVEFWEQPPPPERLARMWPGAKADDCDDLAGLVDRAIAAGFRPLRVEHATADEWAEFESGLAAEGEEWLLTHADHPDAADLRSRLDSQRDMWLRGHRGLLGLAYLTLGPVG
ncbi:SAM-dependent methyltransferase [Asanoa siamensis]|uniref:SAM-dependent methyltransferase n=1 Tax=Asanoa siamensis TaxID=926357 RepID=UPI001944F0C2|nr:class I SAM-dependent methyltransferase [Asanoa siamensis]